MNRLLRIVYLWVLLCNFIQTSDAQRYPITGNVVVLPPYSPYLTDMTNSIPDRINLSLLLLDANEPLEQIGLRLKINGPGISLETKPTFRPNPIDLSYNIPTQLSGFDLSEYFDPQNLRIEGLGLFQRTQFLNNPTLPEGLYTMCFEAFDYRRFDEAPASAEICFMFTIMIHEPPIIITPIGEQTPTDPQNLMFTWIPQHVGNFITNYTLYLYERTNPNDAPVNVINGGGILIDSFQTMINSYNYTGVDPLLEYGTEYVIRVRAFDIDGAQVFDNLGYSPIEMFTYGGDCTAPFDLQGTPTESGEILLTWEGELPDMNPGGGGQTQTTASNTIGRTSTGGGTTPANNSPIGGVSVGNTTNPISGGLNPITSSPTSGSTSSNSGNTSGQFIIEYRNINSASGDWQRAYTFENTYTIPGMEMGQSYEVRVGLLCWGSIEIWSDIIEVQMPDFYCGIQPPSHDLTNSLLNSLVSGDSVYAGDFKVTINEVYGGSNGRFTGTGYISVPYLNFARINVDFIAATFNDEYRLIDGFFDVKGIGAQGLGGDWLNWLDMLLEAVETLDDFLDLESMISGQISELITFANTFMPPDIAQQLQDAQDALDNATTNQEIQDTMDDLNDAINAFNEAMEELLNASYVVFFENNGQSKYGHDRKASGTNEIATNYEDAFTIGGKGGNDSVSYTPDWKSVKTGDVESLKAVLDRELSNLSLWPNNTTFKTLDGTILPSSIYPDEDSISLTINGSTHENVVDVFAVENYTDADGNPLQHIAGKMKVLTLDPIEKKVWIVPVNGAEYPSDPAAVEAELNKVFKGAAVNWSVQQINGFESSFDDTMDDDDSGIWSTLTTEMKRVRADFRSLDYNVDEDEDYIIFICKNSEDPGKMGYMPRASHYGYLFENSISDSKSLFFKSIAHELGHGAFHLKHTWKENNGMQPQGSSFNLMDSKPEGTELRKWQWLHIHNPQSVSLFQDDEESEYTETEYFEKVLQLLRCAFADGLDEIEMPIKYQKGGTEVAVAGFRYSLEDACITQNSNCVTNGPLIDYAFWSVPNRSIKKITNIQNPEISIGRAEIKYGNFIIDANTAIYNYNNLQTPTEHFLNYLQPTQNDIQQEFDYVWSFIQPKLNSTSATFDNGDLRKLKKIASCAANRLGYLDRIAVIKKILASKNFLTEYYEDLILDIINTTPDGDESKLMYDKFITDYPLVKALYSDMHNYGGEKNATRLGVEIHKLFDGGFSKAEKELFYDQIVNSPENSTNSLNRSKLLYFYGFEENICVWRISSEFDQSANTFNFDETIISNRRYEHNGVNPYITCDTENKDYAFEIDDLVAVNFVKKQKDMSIFDQGVIVMPAFVYFVLVDAHENDKNNANLEAIFFVVTTFTPFDEFWFLGKAIQLGNKTLRAMSFLKAKNIASTKKIEVVLDDAGTALKNMSAGKVDNAVKFIDAVALDFYESLVNRGLANLAEKFKNSSKQLDFVAQYKNASVEDLTKLNNLDEPLKLWEDLFNAGAKLASKNPDMVVRFGKLDNSIKPFILKFNDTGTNSTLQKFLNDTDDPDFLAIINDPYYYDHVRSFLGHKSNVDISDISADRADEILDELDDLAGEAGEKLHDWNRRSARWTNNANVFAKADKFEVDNNVLIKGDVDPPCGKWGGNQGREHYGQLTLQRKGSTKNVRLDDAVVDPNPVGYTQSGNPIYRVLYHDSKLTTNSPWTPNQKSEILKIFKDNPNKPYIEFQTRGAQKYWDNNPGGTLEFKSNIRIYREDVWKSYGPSDQSGSVIENTINMNALGFNY